MATIGNTYTTMSDWQSRMDPDGSLAQIIEAANFNNHFITDALMLEGNMSAGHLGTIRTGLPTGTWRQLYQGVPAEKTITKQVTDSVGILETYSRVDKHLWEMQPDPNAWRASEDAGFLEGLTQTIEDTFWHGDTTVNPERFMGLLPRYDSLSALNGGNIIDLSSTGSDQTSIWLVTFHPKTCFTFFGKSTKAGFQMTNLGEQTVSAADDGLTPAAAWYQALVTHFKWQLGLHLADWRYVVRIQVDATNLAAGTVPLKEAMIRAVRKLPNRMGRSIFYMNRQTLTALDIERSAVDGSTDATARGQNMGLTLDQWAGEPTNHFWGIPIRQSDAITDGEDPVGA